MTFPDAYKHIALVDAMPWREDPDAIKAFVVEHGYLFFRGLLDAELLERVRTQVQDHWAEGGLVVADSMPVVAQPDAQLTGVTYAVSDDPRWVDLHRKLYVSDEFWAIGEDPRVLDILSTIFDSKPRTRCGDICRIMLPCDFDRTTPPHQDLFYIGKPVELWTAWFPLVDCPIQVGPLAIVPGTQRRGVWTHTDDRGCEAGLEGSEWATDHLRVGDVLMFHGLTVHGPWHNTSKDRVRLSVDFRYLPEA